MKTIWLSSLLVLVLAPVANSQLLSMAKDQDCDCTIAPFVPDPPCKAKCKRAIKALATGTAEELELIVGLDEDVARRIANWKGRDGAKTLKDYKEVLDEAEIKAVGKKLNSLNKTQLEYFDKSERETEPVRNGMKDIFSPKTKDIFNPKTKPPSDISPKTKPPSLPH